MQLHAVLAETCIDGTNIMAAQAQYNIDSCYHTCITKCYRCRDIATVQWRYILSAGLQHAEYGKLLLPSGILHGSIINLLPVLRSTSG